MESPVTGGLVAVPDQRAYLRSDTGLYLGQFTEEYEPHPYAEWLIDKVGSLLDADLHIGSAGLLKDGKIAWVSVEIPETIATPEGGEFRPHLLGATSFNGSLATTFKRSVTSVVCDNTMNAGLAELGQEIKLRHSRQAVLRLAQARQALNIIYEVADDFAAEVIQLCKTTVTDRQWNAFLDAQIPVPEEKGRSRTLAEYKREQLAHLWKWDERVSPWQHTAYGVLQAVNTYTHHDKTVRGVHRAERNMLRAVTGEIDQIDRQTLDTLSGVLAKTGELQTA